MGYENTTKEDLFRTVAYRWNNNYNAAWLQAENLMELRELFIKWYNLMESGEADNIYPDPFFSKNISQELADTFIDELEKDFLLEKGRWKGLGVNAGPGYTRLKPHSRISLFQEFIKIYKNDTKILDEVSKKQEKNEQIVPDNIITNYRILNDNLYWE